MIDAMVYVAIFSGLVVGLFYLRHIGMVKITLPFYTYFIYRSRDKFYKLYDSTPLDDKLIFNCLKDNYFLKNYMGYLRCHEDARPGAYDDFRIYYVHSKRLLIKYFFLIFIFPSILFLSWWYFYFIAISVVFILLIIYAFVKDPSANKTDGESIVLLTVMDYIQTKRKAKKTKNYCVKIKA